MRHGWPIRIGEAAPLLPIETTSANNVRAGHALISAARAETLRLGNQRGAGQGNAPVLIRAAGPISLAEALPIADPALDPVTPMKGPFRVESLVGRNAAVAALEIARSRFERVSFDLIYARQDQGVDAWRDELARALDFGTDHLSLYQLTIEPGTAFGARHAAGGLAGLPGEDLAADLWEVTQVLTERAGMPAYEISNHARPGAEGRHNLVYWRGGDYAGIGPGAHGRLTLDGIRHATETLAQPGAWLEAVETRGSGESMRVPMAADEVREERILMGLRLREGLPIDVFGDEIGNKVNDLVGMRMIESKGGSIRLTDRGRPVLNAVLRTLLTG